MSSPVQALGRPLSFHSPPTNSDDRAEWVERAVSPSQSTPAYLSASGGSNLRPTAVPPSIPANQGGPYSTFNEPQDLHTTNTGPSSGIRRPSPSAHAPRPSSSGSSPRSLSIDNNAPLDSQSGSNIEREETLRNSSPGDHTASDDLGEPSDRRLKEAALLETSIPGPVAPEKRYLAEGGNRVPQGWKDVEMPEKHHLWHRQVAGPRTKVIKKALLIYGLVTVWVYAFLGFFWGSTYLVENEFRHLTVHVVSFDTDPNSFLNGPILNQATYLANQANSVPHLGYEVHSASEYPNGLADVEYDVMSQGCWAAVVINANATTAWRNAVQNGDTSYDPNGAIGIYYQSARFYQVILLYIEAIITGDLQNPLSTARAAALQSFVTSSTGNATAITTARNAPQAIGVGFGYNVFDLRPIPNGAWASAAPMEASLIYYIIFAFVIAQVGYMSRMASGLNNNLSFGSLLGLRVGWTLLAYFFVSLWETCIVAAWQVPLQNIFGRGGFPILWALNYVTLIAGGWAMETVISLTGPGWFPFFLMCWLIINITSSFFPLELMSSFYRWLYWTPFINNVQGYKIIVYGTDLKHRLGKNFGILFGVIGVELIGLPLAIFYERWSNDRTKLKQKAEQEEKEKKGKKENA